MKRQNRKEPVRPSTGPADDSSVVAQERAGVRTKESGCRAGYPPPHQPPRDGAFLPKRVCERVEVYAALLSIPLLYSSPSLAPRRLPTLARLRHTRPCFSSLPCCSLSSLDNVQRSHTCPSFADTAHVPERKKRLERMHSTLRRQRMRRRKRKKKREKCSQNVGSARPPPDVQGKENGRGRGNGGGSKMWR